eukprot:gene5427-10881_t
MCLYFHLLSLFLLLSIRRVSSFQSFLPHFTQSCPFVTVYIKSYPKFTRLNSVDLGGFNVALKDLFSSHENMNSLSGKLHTAGFESADELLAFTRDFIDRPEVISEIFQKDFGFTALEAHKLRIAVTNTINDRINSPSLQYLPEISSMEQRFKTEKIVIPHITTKSNLTYFEFIVDSNAQKRSANGDLYYGLIPRKGKKADRSGRAECIYTGLLESLRSFWKFMVEPSPFSQDPAIREATAQVYLTHANLFLGWYTQQHYGTEGQLLLPCNVTTNSSSSNKTAAVPASQLSLRDIFPAKDKEYSLPIYEFIIWLRKHRAISMSYEASMLRGLIKLVKYRFSTESTTDMSYGGKSFEDIPLIKEIRKLHREANRGQANAPSASDEKLKWMSWPEYLGVVQAVYEDLSLAMTRAMTNTDTDTDTLMEQIQHSESKAESQSQHSEHLELRPKGLALSLSLSTRKQQRALKEVANLYQKYLLLALLACVPDRQRTFRELELGRTFVRNPPIDNDGDVVVSDSFGETSEEEGEGAFWAIQHGPEDYKTGGSYGMRPQLPIPAVLTPAIDEFIAHWRPMLAPNGPHFFVQCVKGQALSAHSVYHIVSKACFDKTGKKTNPHLLRDMIVTHVRDSDASEKQLEALAIFMGHSIAMQRSSYDRRTLAQKVAPASALLSSIMRKSIKRKHDTNIIQ